MILTDTSKKKLLGVHPDLVRVIKRAAIDWKDSQFTFIVTCGARTLAEQKVLVAKGFSKTLRSRHIPAKNGYSHAVDLAAMLNNKITWDWPPYHKISKAVKEAAKAEGVPIEWGGDWKTFKDGPHFQLPWVSYPGTK